MSTDNGHPGNLVRELAKRHGIKDQKRLAEALKVSRIGVNRLLMARRAMSPTMALRLEALFGTPAKTFLEKQNLFDLSRAYEENREEIEEIRRNAERYRQESERGQQESLAENAST